MPQNVTNTHSVFDPFSLKHLDGILFVATPKQ